MIAVRRLALLLAGGLLGACALLSPQPIPTATQPPATLTPTEAVTSTSSPTIAPTPSQPGPPTAPPPTMAPTVGLPPLADGSEALILSIRMTDGASGWAIGGVGSDDQRLLRTENGGRSWRDVSPPIHEDWVDSGYRSVMAVRSAEAAWILRYRPLQSSVPTGDVAVVWVTDDGGAGWREGVPIAVSFLGTLSSPPYLVDVGTGQGWLLAHAGGAGMHQYPVSLLRTDDGALHWQVLFDPFEATGDGLMSCYKSGMAFGSAGVGLLTIESCPVTGAEVRLTHDGGETWQAKLLPEPESHPGIYDQAVCESHSPNVGQDGQLTVAVGCSLFDPESNEAFIYSSADGGSRWQAGPYPGGAVEYVDQETVWALSREIWRSLDGGQTWEQRKVVFWDGQFSFVSAEVGWAVARQDGELALVTTQDGGETWAIIEALIEAGE